MNTNQHLKLPDGFSIGQLEAILAEGFAFLVEEPLSERLTFYDTFDWRLYNKSLTLHQSGQELLLRHLPDGENLQSLTSTPPPAFARDLPESSFKERMDSVLEARALLKNTEVYIQIRTYRLLNQDEKTVARLAYTQIGSSPGSRAPVLAAYLSLLPVRGYPRYARLLAERLIDIGEICSIWEDIYSCALEKAGKEPGSYSGKLDLQLEPGMRSDEAAKIILRQLLGIIRANQEGVREDIDIEFLHDFRVAIRRTRSAISQIRNVFPAEITTRFKGDFAYLGKLSNELRDLDVYLLSEDKYRAMLPSSMREDISPLFDYLRAQRAQALQDVVNNLNSEKSTRILLDWETFLNEPVSEDNPEANAGVPIIDLARKRIYKRYRRVIKDGDYLLDHPQDKLFHALRIECKKLRYLIEFFASLFPDKKVALLIKQLKRLQDNLGDFNDLSIQQVYLLNITEQLPIRDTRSRKTLVATGYLVDNLAHRQQVVKAAFAETFFEFASPGNQDLYRQLFGTKTKKVSS